MSWQATGACQSAPTELFYPEDHIAQAGSKTWREECEAVINRWCLRCPVRLECFAVAVEQEGTDARGIWGGVHFLDRRLWVSGARPLRCSCGTIIDPLPFLRTGEETTECWECATYEEA